MHQSHSSSTRASSSAAAATAAAAAAPTAAAAATAAPTAAAAATPIATKNVVDFLLLLLLLYMCVCVCFFFTRAFVTFGFRSRSARSRWTIDVYIPDTVPLGWYWCSLWLKLNTGLAGRRGPVLCRFFFWGQNPSKHADPLVGIIISRSWIDDVQYYD